MNPSAQVSMIYFVSGMWCGTCARSIKESVSGIQGVRSSELNYATKLLHVIPDSDVPPERLDQQIRDRVKGIGFGIKRQTEGWVLKFHEDLKKESERRISWVQVFIVFFLGMWSSMLALSNYLGDLSGTEQYYLALASSLFGFPAIIYGMLPFGRAGLRAIFFSRTLTFDLIIFTGAMSALIYSAYSLSTGSSVTYADSASMVLGLLLLTKRSELSIAEKLTAKLMFELQPGGTNVEVYRKGEWTQSEVSKLRRNEKIRVAPQEIIPVDGVLLSPGSINNHLMSGEDSLLTLKPGDAVYAGAVAGSLVELKIVSPQGERLIDGWAATALGAAKGSRYSKILAKAESLLVLLALIGATAVALMEFRRGGTPGSMAEAFFVGILVFCPCLFATIVPLSKQLAYLALRRAGVALSRSEALLDIVRIKNFVFDKTGTLEAVDSTYQPIQSVPGVEELINELSIKCPHPVLRGLEKTGNPRDVIQSFREFPGSGVIAQLEDGAEMIVGRREFLTAQNIEVLDSTHPSFPLVAYNGEVVGEIVKKPIYDENSVKTMEWLLKADQDVEVHILSGDPDLSKGERYSSLDSRVKYFGNVRPEGKARFVQERESAFIGDGLNDVLALAAAKVGIRVGRRILNYSQVDFHLLTSRLESLLRILKYGRKYRRVLIQTGCAALCYNAIAMTLALSGMFNPLGAVLAMAGSFSLMLLSIWRLNRVPEVLV